MYSDEDLDSAVTAGVLTTESVALFRKHVAEKMPTLAVDEENFRLVSSFNDIFVVIAGALLLVSVGWIGKSMAQWLGPLAVAVVSWGLAEFFVRRRRMALPAIVFLLTFVGGAFYAFALAIAAFMSHPPVFGEGRVELPGSGALVPASLLAAIACVAHWRRFQVPITIAAGTLVVLGGVIISLVVTFPSMRDWVMPLLFLAGATAFVSALWWDMSDITRVTRRSDVAFWLHLSAAPLMVHPLFASFSNSSGVDGVAQTGIVLLLYLLLALVSLAIDRRALMVSALGYVLYAFTALLKDAGVVSMGFAITALFLGSMLLLLSAFWHKSRVLIVGRLPLALQKRIAPLR